MLTRAAVVAVALMAVTGCGSSSGDSSTTSSTTTAPVGSCVPTPENPSLGMVAITDEYQVHLWDQPGVTGHRDLPQVGDNPLSQDTGGDLTVVETVAVVPQTCAIFAGACCEPASGVTFYGGESSGAWKSVVGRLPTVSPDGNHLAVVGWEDLTVSTTQTPDVAMKSFKIPSGESTVMIDSMWIDNDRIALLGYNEAGTYVWVAALSTGEIAPAVLVSTIVNSESPDVTAVHLGGVDDDGNIVVLRPVKGGQQLLLLSSEKLDTTSKREFPQRMASYFNNGARTVQVDDDGVLTLTGRGGPELRFGRGYLWAR